MRLKDKKLKKIIKIFKIIFNCIYIIKVVLDCKIIHSFSILSNDRSKASSKTIPPHSAI